MPESKPESHRADGVDLRLRSLPSVDRVLADRALDYLRDTLPAPLLIAAVREVLEEARTAILAGDRPAPTLPELAERAAAIAADASTGGLRHVINATGVIIHTNLGRAPLSDSALRAVSDAAAYSNLEFDLAAGERGSRYTHAVSVLQRVTGCEDALVVNNNAAALVLAATALTSPDADEIVVSRGELIEIGDRFRLPDLLVSTGARLREVGTTNRTTRADYAAATGPRTAFILKVHPSNFRVEGFTTAVAIPELAGLGPPVVFDIGSGLLVPHPLLPGEPDAATALRDGAALVTASGDKLLGGPQAGLLLGRSGLVRTLTRHPLARALRVDKLTLAALEATLAGPVPPVAAALAADPASVLKRAERVVARLVSAGLDARVAAAKAAVGGGGAPGVELESAAVSLPESLAVPLRRGDPAVVGRLESGRLLLDLRSVSPDDDERLTGAILSVAGTELS